MTTEIVFLDKTIDQITVKDGIKAVVKIHQHTASRYDLLDSQGQVCLLVIGGSEPHLVGINDIAGEEDQLALNIG